MILLEKKWRLPDENNGAAAVANEPDDPSAKGGEYGNLSPLLTRLLISRGIKPSEADAFMAKNPQEWHDPFLMNDMTVAVERIFTAIGRDENILILGDYDADGVTSTVILLSFFRRIGVKADYVIPDRVSEGYGISDALLKRVEEKKPDLVITVDCGIANYEQIETLMQENIDVIVTDHHEVKEELPPALAVIDCKRKDNTYPFSHLCGAGVALKLVTAICKKKAASGEETASKLSSITEETWRDYIDIAALGTIADVVSLKGENRTIVKLGIPILNHPERVGLCALLDLLRELSGKPGREYNSIDISYQITPKINACGRVGDVNVAVKLLLTEDPKEARMLAGKLMEDNKRRQDLEMQILSEAIRKIEGSEETIHSLQNPSMPIILVGEGWHMGILGIVASRIVERYHHSAIVFAKDTGNEGLLKGSCRISGDFPILECLKYCGDTVKQFGGHQRAAGVSVEEKQFEAFRKKVSAFAEERNKEEDLQFLQVDQEILPSELVLESAEELRDLEPFGEGNKEPVFLIHQARIADSSTCGDGKHLKLQLVVGKKDEEKTVDAIAFGLGEVEKMYVPGTLVDVLVRLSVNSWNGRDSLKLMVVDMHFAPVGKLLWDSPQVLEKLYRNKIPISQIPKLCKCKSKEELLPTGEEMGILYRYLRSTFTDKVNLVDVPLLSRLLTGNVKKPFHAFKIARAMDIFQEAGLVSLYRINDERLCFSLLSVQSKVKLESTDTYKALYG